VKHTISNEAALAAFELMTEAGRIQLAQGCHTTTLATLKSALGTARRMAPMIRELRYSLAQQVKAAEKAEREESRAAAAAQANNKRLRQGDCDLSTPPMPSGKVC